MTLLLDVRNLSKTFSDQGTRQESHPAQSLQTRLRHSIATLFTRRLNDVVHNTVLHNVNFSIDRAEAVGVVGASGSGKSTLASLIARLRDPSSGSIHYNAEDIGLVPARRSASALWRSEIQLVPQDCRESLNPNSTAFSTIKKAVAARARRLENRQQHLQDQVFALAQMVELPPGRLHARPHQLSGGEVTRVAIARALAWKPALLILDEPTASLDVSVQAGILKLLDGLRRDHGTTMIFISHDLDIVRLLCDRILVMDRGRIVDSLSATRLSSLMLNDITGPLHTATHNLLSAHRA